eukprot:TRINITY_DN4037_c0_g1_i1.p1 TRINITY_DN4037_c0_g1~~TRINITY_DN4037_c0_g1_i1.p1  ORF type:complete len:948 (+),score=205.10 TRINITY_DN4037_c0_g1_i1:78-2921(+)
MRSTASSQRSSLHGSSDGDSGVALAPSRRTSGRSAEQSRLFSQPRLTLENRGLGDGGVAKVVRRIAENPHVTFVDLRNNNVGDAGARDLARLLTMKSPVHSLLLADNNIGDAGATDIMESLRGNRHLRVLDLRFNSITHAAASAVGDMLRSNVCLESLDLQLNNIGRQGAAAIAKGLERNTALRTLTLGFNNVGDQGAAALAGALLSNSTLQTLQLPNNNIGNEGTRKLSEALEHNRSLTALDIHKNERITDQGLTTLELALEKHNRSLINLELGPLPRGVDRTLARNRALAESRSARSRDDHPSDRHAAGGSPSDEMPARRTSALRSLSAKADEVDGGRQWVRSAKDDGVRSWRSGLSEGLPQQRSGFHRQGLRGSDTGSSSDNAEPPARGGYGVRTPTRAALPRRGSAQASSGEWEKERPRSTSTGSPSLQPSLTEGEAVLVTGDDVSRQLFHDRILGQNQRLVDGSHHFHGLEWKSLGALRALPVVLPRGDDDYLAAEERCVVLVDRGADPRLRLILRRCKAVVGPIFDVRTRVQTLALLVSSYMGGVCSNSHRRHSEEVARAKRERHSNLVPLCAVECGGTRHRSLLYKCLCDSVGIACSVESPHDPLADHLWNTVALGMNKSCVVDLAGSPGELYPVDSDSAAKYRATGSSSTGAGGFDSATDASPGSRYLVLPDSTTALKKHGKLGGGSTGSVYRCTLGGVTFAAKKVQLTQGYRQGIREVIILEQLCHDNVVRYLGHEAGRDGEINIFMEYLPWSLHSWIRKQRSEGGCFQERDMLHIALGVVKGLHYIHEKAPVQIVHRDLKSKNILLDVDADDEIKDVKLCDFGVSKILSVDAAPETMVGTYYWMAPEILRNDHAGYSVKADVWSFGMVCVELLTLRNPYNENGGDWSRTRTLILRGVPPQIPPTAPQRMRELVSLCVRLRPDDRPSTRDLMIRMISD